MTNKKQATVTEHGYIGCGKLPFTDKYISDRVSEKAFEALEKFNAINNDSIFTVTRAVTDDGSRVKALKAKSYVGVIETKCGTVVEILPKIYIKDDTQKQNGIETTRKIFLTMLRYLRDAPFREIDTAHLFTARYNLLEIFIALFIRELAKLIQKGVVKDYVNIEENNNFLKGRLLFNQNAKYNFIHKERFYVSYDEFITNRPENRLIKSTLDFLLKRSVSSENQKGIREFLFTFDEIPLSDNIDIDFLKVRTNRLMSHYKMALDWCRIFLKKESFTNFRGNSVALALLFPMEKIFEDFVSIMFKRQNPELAVRLQSRGKYLVEKHGNGPKFQLIPDIVAYGKPPKPIILDAKWKLLNQNDLKNNYNISIGDLYQLFAYGKKYESEELYLLYPENENFNAPLNEFKYEENISLKTVPLKLAELASNNKVELSLDSLRDNI
jgi:5-methylcytosine-specific restriction enzyme subunit McrC